MMPQIDLGMNFKNAKCKMLTKNYQKTNYITCQDSVYKVFLINIDIVHTVSQFSFEVVNLYDIAQKFRSYH